jgi:hypothetical protein
VAMTVNYSISLGLELSGTVEAHVNNAGRNFLRGYRGALYMGIGLVGLGLVVSICVTYVCELRKISRRSETWNGKIDAGGVVYKLGRT